MRLAAVLYFLLLVLITFNLVALFELSLWIAFAVVVIIAIAFAGARYGLQSDDAQRNCLSICGIAGLVAVAFGFCVPAWDIINSGSSGAWTKPMVPIFVFAGALYAARLWLEAYGNRADDPMEAIATYIGGPSLLIAFVAAVILCAASLLALEWLGQVVEDSTSVTRRFLDRGIIPPITILLFFWGLLLLLSKWWNVRSMQRSLNSDLEDVGSEYSISARILDLMQKSEPHEERLAFLWRRHEESFLIPRYITWVVPVLGFIGTVLGISLAADGIRRLIASESGLSGLSGELGTAIAPMGIAFDTTLIALSLSVVLTLVQSLVQRSEERVLTALEWRIRDHSSES